MRGPSSILLDIVRWWDHVAVAIGGIHSPTHVIPVGNREKRQLPVPMTVPKAPAYAKQVNGERWVEKGAAGESEN